jgi:hypothetical protein
LNAFEMEKEMKREMGKEIIFVCTAWTRRFPCRVSIISMYYELHIKISALTFIMLKGKRNFGKLERYSYSYLCQEYNEQTKKCTFYDFRIEFCRKVLVNLWLV